MINRRYTCAFFAGLLTVLAGCGEKDDDQTAPEQTNPSDTTPVGPGSVDTTDTGEDDTGEAGDTGAETSLEEAFCELLVGPEQEYEAALDGDEAPTIDLEDALAEIDLEEDGEDFYGVVRFSADEDGFFVFGLGEQIPFEVTDLSGDDLDIVETVVGSEYCDELAIRHTVELTAGEYLLHFGPTDEDEVDLVGEESDDDL